MNPAHPTLNVDPAELQKFDAMASRWWDPNGDFRPLHDINPVRVAYIAERSDLQAGPVVDVGCGGGLLTEALAKQGAIVTGIDMAPAPLSVAKLHAIESEVDVTYEQTTAEALAAQLPGHFHTVTCLEMLEHVPDYVSTMAACAKLCAPGGSLFFATINRHPKAYALAILGAEYVLNLLPKGTHEYNNFIRPSELSRGARQAGLELCDIRGMRYNPFTHKASLCADVDVNYIVHARKPG